MQLLLARRVLIQHRIYPTGSVFLVVMKIVHQFMFMFMFMFMLWHVHVLRYYSPSLEISPAAKHPLLF